MRIYYQSVCNTAVNCDGVIDGDDINAIVNHNKSGTTFADMYGHLCI